MSMKLLGAVLLAIWTSVVCAVVPEETRTYRLRDFDSAEAATAAGAIPTHTGTCGLCSTLTDLAVYMRHSDLTEPVRACGLESGDMAEHLACRHVAPYILRRRVGKRE